ncbi:capsular polysaccharide export protein, LipB/KpsS family [Novosphingobium sp. Leaf2]|uniref:capsular polysaccharide export protein, LipB/KpsS family n=1 Tax=Novosphingobium sp. Leaf2 TaxID=1735670 RepID=UPI002E0EA4F2
MSAILPLLRSPPFPKAHGSVSCANECPAGNGEADEMLAVFARIRAATVGGRFWAEPAALDQPVGTVLRPRRVRDLAAHLEALNASDRRSAVWIATDRHMARALAGLVAKEGGAWRGDVDPWSVLDKARCLAAHGDDEWVALARIAGVPVRILSPGRFGGGDSAMLDCLAYRAVSGVVYRNPFTGEPAGLNETIDVLAGWRAMLDANRPIAVACGMAWWKRSEIQRFLWHPQRRLRMVRSPTRALAVAQKAGGAVAIWPSRVSPALIAGAQARSVPLVRVEDGFVRSAGLGVDLVPPSSVVVDASGIHFDPSGPSDLEHILSTTDFAPALLARARALRETIVAAGISKYAAGDAAAKAIPARNAGHRRILVPAQVEDDMSMLAAGGGLSNLDLLRRARALEPDAEIWFRPHPDVDAGHRKGAVPDSQVLEFADKIMRGGGMAPLLDAVDGVHVLTSLTGFEALLRGRDVTCHGTPFYAGWGLTRDLGAVPERRGRALSLDALVAGVLILYPRYLDPVSGLPCPPEVLVGRMANATAVNRLGWVAPLRRWQGRLMTALRRG